jgi:hypothetical protein
LHIWTKQSKAIGQKGTPVKSSPISPLKSTEATRLALVVESLVHGFDHYGQMVEYLRMNTGAAATRRKAPCFIPKLLASSI